MLIPPLSHFNKLPNEALADCLKETLIRLENAGRWKVAFDTCIEVINAIQYREVKDSFANSAVYFDLTLGGHHLHCQIHRPTVSALRAHTHLLVQVHKASKTSILVVRLR